MTSGSRHFDLLLQCLAPVTIIGLMLGLYIELWTPVISKLWKPDTLSESELKLIEKEFSERKFNLKKNCKKYKNLLPHSRGGHTMMRYDSVHGLAYCENYKIASSTWAVHLLGLYGIIPQPHTQIHRLANQIIPPITDNTEREMFLARATSFLVVRDPFERLLSAFNDKLSRLITPGNSHPTDNNPHRNFAPFGLIQEYIFANYSENRNTSSVRDSPPTFEEFIRFLVNEVSIVPWEKNIEGSGEEQSLDPSLCKL